MAERSIVEYFAEHEGYKCGYCKSPDTNYSHGMWAHSMTTSNYENLLNRGWRRSGRYMYKPTNNMTCCPMYTISCEAVKFKISRSQKRVMKKLNHYLESGDVPAKNRHSLPVVLNNERDSVLPTASSQDLTILANNQSIIIKSEPSPLPSSTKSLPSIPIQQISIGKKQTNPKKAKYMRLLRRKERLLSKGLDPATVVKPLKTPKKSLEDFLASSKNAKEKLTVKHLKAGTPEFDQEFDVSHQLYEKYQMQVHKDTKDDCSKKQFKRFLCESPLIQTSSTGTYHDHYYIGSKLVGIGVVDVLPSCLSSVYFFYDPDFYPLTLGTVGALFEIAFVRQANLSRPNFKFYYMGFYIHSCTKMRYKGSFSPSYLLCPLTYSWHLLNKEIRGRLDVQKYVEFQQPSGENNRNEEQEDIKQVVILYRGCMISYEMYVKHRPSFQVDDEEIQQYANLVGSLNTKRILLYRSTKE